MNPTALATLTAQQWISVLWLAIFVGCAGYTAYRLAGQHRAKSR